MTKPRSNTIDFNHFCNDLTPNQKEALMKLYRVYHRQCWGYKKMFKRLKQMLIVGNSVSLLFASGGIVSSIATGGVSLVAITTGALLIQGYMKHKNFDAKIKMCQYAYQSYQHVIDDIKIQLRSGDVDIISLLNKLNSVDMFITDICPIVDKYLLKYDKMYGAE